MGPGNVAEGVSVTADIMGGQPCIAGTRIPTYCIRSLAKSGYGASRIISEYPDLRAWQIANALAWEMRPAKERNAVAPPEQLPRRNDDGSEPVSFVVVSRRNAF